MAWRLYRLILVKGPRGLPVNLRRLSLFCGPYRESCTLKLSRGRNLRESQQCTLYIYGDIWLSRGATKSLQTFGTLFLEPNCQQFFFNKRHLCGVILEIFASKFPLATLRSTKPKMLRFLTEPIIQQLRQFKDAQFHCRKESHGNLFLFRYFLLASSEA